MKEKRDRTPFNFGSRLAALRKEKGLTQGQFCELFSLYCGLERQLRIPSLSSWEQNHRVPQMQTIVQLALYFGVSCDYLFGLTDSKTAATNGRTIKSAEELSKGSGCQFLRCNDTPIPSGNMPQYNGQPVFVKFKNNTHLNQWGILDYNNKKIICKNFIVALTVNVDCYSYASSSPIRTQISSYQQLLQAEYIWIEMKSSDTSVQSYFNGRYRHNDKKEFLIKLDNGTPLSYEGLDSVFWAFKG